MDNVLIISSSESGIDVLAQKLKAEYKSTVTLAKSASVLAQYAAERSSAAMIMFVKAELEAQLEENVTEYGAFVLAKPLNRVLLRKALRFIYAMNGRIRSIQNENIRLQRKIDDTRLINRAKGILIEYLSMTEPQAHKYLERQAMDLRISKTEVAKRLLSTYEN